MATTKSYKHRFKAHLPQKPWLWLMGTDGRSKLWLLAASITVLCVLGWLLCYCLSPYWHSRAFIHQLRENNQPVAEQLIPASLLQPYQANALAVRNLTSRQWHGAGRHYLKQVWPKVAQQQNMHQLLLLQLNSAPAESVKTSYTSFPSRFRLSIGDNAQNTLWFEWQRQGWTHWTLTKLCLYNPQPVVEVNNCLSSSR